tara:strand:+ start:1674 stop:2333 length:660 start_codon:yes stop_codon:yes gene_type:complete
MKNKIIIFFIILTSCSSEKENLIIEGEINGVKNSKIYLLIADDGIIMDSTNVIDGKFNLKTFLDEPKEISLILENINSKNKFDFITEPTNILFTSSKDKFVFNGKIKNSKLYSEFITIDNQINKFDEKDLELLAKQIEFSVKADQKKYDSLNKERIKINQKKILFIVNHSINNNSSPVSAFIIHKYKKSINKNYIEKVYNNFSDEIKDSYYGKKLVFNP